MLLDVAAAPSGADDATQILSVPVGLRRSGREIRMLIDRTDPFATAKPDARLVKLLVRALRFNAALIRGDGVPFAALAKREGVSPSYFTRLVRLSYLAPDIIQAILDGRQPRDLTADRLLAHSRLPLAWHDQRTALSLRRRIGALPVSWCVRMNLGDAIIEGEDTSSEFLKGARPSSPHNLERALSAAKSANVSVKPRSRQPPRPSVNTLTRRP